MLVTGVFGDNIWMLTDCFCLQHHLFFESLPSPLGTNDEFEKGRTWLGCQHLQLFAVGYISLSLIAYYARDWHNMQLIISRTECTYYAYSLRRVPHMSFIL